MAGAVGLEFEDHFPWLIESIGLEGLVEELCKGFMMLMDVEKGLITFESLKRKSASVLGLHDMADDELVYMLREGDLDGDGALDQIEFCVLMFRLSPALMELSWMWMQEKGNQMMGKGREAADTVTDKAQTAKDATYQKAQQATDKTKETAQLAKDKAQENKDSAGSYTAQAAKDKTAGAAQYTKEKAAEAAQSAQDTAGAGTEKAGGMLQKTGEQVKNMAQGATVAVKQAFWHGGAGPR